MPVIKNAKIGKHQDVTVVEFGTGDIAISNGHESENPSIKTLTLSQDVQKPVKEYNDEMDIPGGNSDGLDVLGVLLKFTRVESVDVLIDRLNRVKNDLLKGVKN